jgi:hypothetical protein
MVVFKLIFAVTFISKLFLHVFIANRNNNPLVYSGTASSGELFWFYLKPVSVEYQRMRKICNLLHFYNLVFIIIISIQIMIKI